MQRAVGCFFLVVSGCRRRAVLRALEAAFPGVPKRPTNREAAIHDEGSHSELGCGGGPSFFFL
jgi:hypothetical protein